MVEVYGLLRRFERPASSEAGPGVPTREPVVWKGQDRMSQASSTVGDVGSTPTTGTSFTRRLRVLAHLQPLNRGTDKRHSPARAGGAERRWDVYDMRLLQLAAFDAITAEYGLHPEGGVPHDHVEREIAIQAGRTAPDQSTEDHADVASWLVDRLLNVGHAARGFDVSWVDPADGYRRDDLRVIALYETLTSDGEVRLHADEAALNLALADSRSRSRRPMRSRRRRCCVRRSSPGVDVAGGAVGCDHSSDRRRVPQSPRPLPALLEHRTSETSTGK